MFQVMRSEVNEIGWCRGNAKCYVDILACSANERSKGI